METGEGGETEAGFDDALDDVGGFGGFGGRPVIGDGFGDAAEFDDGELMGELAFEGVDAAAELGEGHGSTSRGGTWRGSLAWMDRIGDGIRMVGIWGNPAQIRSFPFICAGHMAGGGCEMVVDWAGFGGGIGGFGGPVSGFGRDRDGGLDLRDHVVRWHGVLWYGVLWYVVLW